MAEIIIDLLLAAVVAATIVFQLYIARKDPNGLKKKQKNVLVRIRISALIALILQFITADTFHMLDEYTFASFGRILRLAAYFSSYYIIGQDILKKALKGIRNKQVFDENFLMATATVGALAIAIAQDGDYLEAIAVMLFYQLGELFEGYAVGKSRRNIQELMDIRPDYANVEQDGKLQKVAPDSVQPGNIIVVQPGEKIPIDGEVVEGFSALNTSALTGESIPLDVAVGDEVVSGCINLTGVLRIRTTKDFGASTVSRILELVENASSRKSKSEDFIAKFARIYTPVVCYAALALAILPTMVRLLFLGLPADFGIWVYRALTFLVISCPCALVISIPLTFFAGIGGASREGILIKGSNYLETLSKVKTVVLDKTGTLTKGIFEVVGIHHNTIPEDTLLEYAAHVEAASSHPIARSILTAYGKEVRRDQVTEVRELSGYGITARVDGKAVAVGNGKLMEQMGIAIAERHSNGTILHVAIDGAYAGQMEIADTLKPTSVQAIQMLKNAGVRKTVMLTGDASNVAQSIGASLGMDEIHGELLPDGKVREVERLLEEKTGNEKLAFIGDGINDAPVLSRADIGIAMGAMGSDAAIEAADVVLMDDDPLKIAQAINISRKCISIVYQNIIFALAVKFACLVLGAIGITNMWFAIFADVGVMVLAVLNAVRALHIKKKNNP